jgi:predicted TIM-barrel fold metal-dependent hydrolase
MVDFHTHCYPPRLAKRAIGSTILRNTGNDATPEGLLSFMEKNEVSRSVVLHVANTAAVQRNVNLFAININSDVLVSFGSVHPEASDALDELDWLKAQGIQGIKLHPIFQHCHIDDPAFIPVYKKIGRLGFITMVHCGNAGTSQEFACGPSAMARVIEYFYGAPVIMAHMGGVLIKEEEYPILYTLPVYIDVSLSTESVPPKYPILLSREMFTEVLMRHGVERVLFGSDYPWGSVDNPLSYLGTAGLTGEQMDMILHKNAEKLLKIPSPRDEPEKVCTILS